MAARYVVTRLWIKYKGAIYREGELLPESFTQHDLIRSMYPRRVGVVEIPDEPETPEGANPGEPSTTDQTQQPPPAAQTPVAPIVPTPPEVSTGPTQPPSITTSSVPPARPSPFVSGVQVQGAGNAGIRPITITGTPVVPGGKTNP